MPSPLKEQLEADGVPIKKGIRSFQSENSAPWVIASDTWLHRWAKHAAQNYPIVSRSFGTEFLTKCAINIPAFIVGIGPSLDDNIKDLKLAKGRALILATDASLRPLLANDITPDLVMTFDCQQNQKTTWATADTKDIPLICNSCSHPDTIADWGGPILFYNQWHKRDVFIQNLLPHIYQHIGKIPSSGTVGNMLVVLAKHMGCDPVMTVGMDLCYQPVAKERDEGSPPLNPMNDFRWKYRCQDYELRVDEEGICEYRKTENKTLYDNDQRVARTFEETIGKTVYRTDPELKSYREAILGIADGLQFRITDCSDGVLKEYFRNISVQDAVMEQCLSGITAGRTIVPFLKKLIPDGKKLWQEDSRNGCNY